jgi:hypothetical protein
VLDIRVGGPIPQAHDKTHRLVELRVEDGRHLFVCPAADLAELRSSLEQHAPHLCRGIPVSDTTSDPSPSTPDTALQVPSLLLTGAHGQVLVPGTGLHATRRGLGVTRAGRTVRSWPWARVLDIRVGGPIPQAHDKTHRLVELRVEDGRHLFVCPAADLAELRSSLEQHAPHLCRGIPVSDTASDLFARTLDTALRVPSLLRDTLLRQVFVIRHWRNMSMRERLTPVGVAVSVLALLGTGIATGTGFIGGSAPAAGGTSRSSGSIMARMGREHGSEKVINLPSATAPPAPAPPSLADSPALKSHEIFGFAPYWTLSQASSFDLKDLTTLAYFSIDVNSDGTLNRSGSGWVGYESQDLADLITDAHAAGDRVVLTTTCFDQATLDALTSNPSAPATLASSLVDLLRAKNLDGVNFDFEGTGSQDQSGLDRLVSEVSTTLKGVDPEWQVTMDTYASAAGDPDGFYDIPGLADSVDAFFVMAYDMDDPSVPSPTAPLGGSGFTDLDALEQYTAVVPASKVILGVPYYGYDWPTTGPADGDPASGDPSPLSYSQIAAGDHPVYWDISTQTPWSSYEVGTQWHQVWFDDATSLALKAQLANRYDIAGLGVWALGMDGNDPSMIAALLGDAPVVKDYQPAPPPSPSSPGQTGSSTTTSTSNPSPTNPSGQKGHGSSGSTTTTTTVPGGAGSGGYTYTGTWNGEQVTLELVSPQMRPPSTTQRVGWLTGFSTDNPTYQCLESGTSIPIYPASDTKGGDVVEATTPTDCAQGTWEVADQPLATGTGSQSSNGTSSTTTTTTNGTSTTAAGHAKLEVHLAVPTHRGHSRSRASRPPRRPALTLFPPL